MKIQKVFPAIVLAAATLFVAPSAVAGPAGKVITVTFKYHRAAPAAMIYASLEKTAHRACTDPGPLSFKARRAEKECETEVMDKIVAKMNRLDVAAMHYRTQPMVQVASIN